MRKPAELPKSAGVYVLIHEERKLAYVGNCANIRHRAAIWDYNFKKLAKDPEHRMPVRDFPKDTSSDEWQFGGWEGYTSDALRSALVAQGYTIMNDKMRLREKIEYNGRTMSLSKHAEIEGVPYSKVYWRFKAGKPLNEVFAKDVGNNS